MKNKPLLFGLGGLVIVCAILGYSLYSYKRTVRNLKSVSAGLEQRLTLAQSDFEAKSKEFADEIFALQNRSDVLTDALLTEQRRNTSVEATVGQVTTTVAGLEKLSRTDPELLKQYSKVYFLNEHYVPVSLTTVDPKFIFTPGKILQIHSNVAPSLSNLLNAAAASGLSLKLDSAYRSFGTQAVLKSSYKVTYGAGTANSFSAEQGYSEHQLGTAVDFTANSINGGLSGFDSTPEYQWLLGNAYKYGFVISYPESNTSYQFEPWHWRFVGKALALYLHQNNLYFYNVDQRVLDSYLANIFD